MFERIEFSLCFIWSVEFWNTCISCNHGCILFIFVSFLAKEWNNFTFMGTLAKPLLGTMLITPKPYAYWPIIFATSLCYNTTSLCCTMKAQKVPRKAKNSLDGFFIPFRFTSSFCASKNSSIFKHFKAYFDALPSSYGFKCEFKLKISKEQGVETCFLAHSTLGVEGHVKALGWN